MRVFPIQRRQRRHCHGCCRDTRAGADCAHRLRVSNDNPCSEALFKTLKYGPEFPERFASIHDARAFISGFVDWFNHHHQHSGIGFHAPRERPLRPRRRRGQRTLGDARGSPRETPRTLHNHNRPQNPCAPRTGMDQPTQGKHATVSSLTPTGTAQLEKFRRFRDLLSVTRCRPVLRNLP
jgi:hypothetical protein